MTENRNREKREVDGRFAPGTAGGPGRKPGTSNKSTVDAKKVKQAILDSWDEVDGPRILRELAERDPVEYLRLVAKVLPREDAVEVVSPHLDNRPFTPARVRFAGEAS